MLSVTRSKKQRPVVQWKGEPMFTVQHKIWRTFAGHNGNDLPDMDDVIDYISEALDLRTLVHIIISMPSIYDYDCMIDNDTVRLGRTETSKGSRQCTQNRLKGECNCLALAA